MTTLDYPYPLFEEGVRPRHSEAMVPSLFFAVLSIGMLMVMGHEVAGRGATLAISCWFTGMLWFCTWRKYRGRWDLNGETAFVVAITISFGASAMAWLILVPSDDSNYRMYGGGERTIVKDYWAQGLLILGAFMGSFLATSALFRLPHSRREPDGRLPLVITKRSFIVMGFFTLQLWIIRATLLATGSFYHVHRSNFQREDYRYQSMAQFDGGMGPVLVAFLWAGVFTGNVGISWAAAYLALDFGWNFLSGGRMRTFAGPVAAILCYIIYRRKIPIKTLLLAAGPIIFLVGFMDEYRQNIHTYSDTTSIRFSAIWEAASSAEQKTEKRGVFEALLAPVVRLVELDSVARVFQGTGIEQPFLNGETYLLVPLSVIPRQLWTDKPLLSTGINLYYFRHEGGQSPLTQMGEAWINFGIVGVIMAGIASSLMVRGVDWVLRKLLTEVAMLPVYVGFLVIQLHMPVDTMAVVFSAYIKVIILALIVWGCSRRFGSGAINPNAAVAQ